MNTSYCSALRLSFLHAVETMGMENLLNTEKYIGVKSKKRLGQWSPYLAQAVV